MHWSWNSAIKRSNWRSKRYLVRTAFYEPYVSSHEAKWERWKERFEEEVRLINWEPKWLLWRFVSGTKPSLRSGSTRRARPRKVSDSLTPWEGRREASDVGRIVRSFITWSARLRQAKQLKRVNDFSPQNGLSSPHNLITFTQEHEKRKEKCPQRPIISALLEPIIRCNTNWNIYFCISIFRIQMLRVMRIQLRLRRCKPLVLIRI